MFIVKERLRSSLRGNNFRPSTDALCPSGYQAPVVLWKFMRMLSCNDCSLRPELYRSHRLNDLVLILRLGAVLCNVARKDLYGVVPVTGIPYGKRWRPKQISEERSGVKPIFINPFYWCMFPKKSQISQLLHFHADILHLLHAQKTHIGQMPR